ncbi:hypothetical protein SAMN05428985_106303 [Nocardioides sp. YR527]|uniref:hypothetical protein n=1 Tax=Nocardioides sp. YR527 TaxID=1881028 RepID=UPI0008812A1E|nr:hypothetical protein [Nocardioides sp. YR527]SDK83774.1 hypothetical protein SAMN05428985_106303 [Nocardioides sp. YR527]
MSDNAPLVFMVFFALVLTLVGCSDGESDSKSSPSSDGQKAGLLEDVFAACSTGEVVDWKAYGSQAPPVDDVVQLSDDGNTITVMTPRTQGEDLGNLGYWVGDCILTETRAPKSVTDALVDANLNTAWDEHQEIYDSSTLAATISFDWYDHESEAGTSWDATFQAEPH